MNSERISDSPKESTTNVPIQTETKSAGESDSSSPPQTKSESSEGGELTVYDVKVRCGVVGYPLKSSKTRKADPKGIMHKLSENKGYTPKMAMSDLDLYALDKSRGEA